MPNPTPTVNETKADFNKRCIPFFIGEGRTKKEAVAICAAIYSRSTRKEDLFSEHDVEKPLGYPTIE